jgi:hypothetical protein
MRTDSAPLISRVLDTAGLERMIFFCPTLPCCSMVEVGALHVQGFLHANQSGLMSHLAQSLLVPADAGRACDVTAVRWGRRRYRLALIPRVCVREQATPSGEELR